MAEIHSFNSQPHALSHSTSRRKRTSTDSNSPEFEFWMVRNPSCPQPNLLSADELFVDGVLLPLQRLHLPPDPNPDHSDPPDPNPKPISEPPVPDREPSSEEPVLDQEPEPGPGPELSAAPALTASKRWRDIFKKGEKKTVKGDESDKEKEKKKERKGGSGTSSAELNINIWPFSRSRSAGNAYTRPKSAFGATATRKVNSAPCSRSNSTGESKSRKWPPASPGRAGVHLGRSSPVWQARRVGSVAGKGVESQHRNAEKGIKKEIPEGSRSRTAAGVGVGGGGGAKARVLNLNVPMCIGYRSHLSCRSDENSALGVLGSGGGCNNRGGGGSGVRSGGGNGVGGNGGAGGNLFNLRSLFTKKVY